jgi:hypothetical protein
MRNDTDRWAAPLGENRADVVGENATLSLCKLPRQTLLSGPIEPCLALAKQQVAIGWPEVVPSKTYALRLRRDRILAVNGPALADGWNEEIGVAISDMSGGYAVLQLSGTGALSILATGTELTPNLTSRSAMRRFYRQEVVLYRWQNPTTYRLHIERVYLEHMWDLLAGLVSI